MVVANGLQDTNRRATMEKPKNLKLKKELLKTLSDEELKSATGAIVTCWWSSSGGTSK
jgi:hypothetical protein